MRKISKQYLYVSYVFRREACRLFYLLIPVVLAKLRDMYICIMAFCRYEGFFGIANVGWSVCQYSVA